MSEPRIRIENVLRDYAEMNPGTPWRSKCEKEAADEIQSLRQRVERLEGGLRFYADLDDWDEFRADEAASAFDRNFGSKLGADMGRTARAALSPPRCRKESEDGRCPP